MKLQRLLSVLLIAGLGFTGMVHADLNEGLVAHYPFNGDANDESLYGNHGTVKGAVLSQDRFGKVDRAYLFDGNSSIEVGNSEELNFDSDSFTLAAWFKTTSTGWRRIISKGHYGWNQGYILGMAQTVIAGIGGNGNAEMVATRQTYNDGKWHHATLVVHSDLQKAVIYVDGIKQQLEENQSQRCGTLGGEGYQFDLSGRGNPRSLPAKWAGKPANRSGQYHKLRFFLQL